MLLLFLKIFSQLFQSKVVRVLNLWQKNNIFGEEVIQPLFDLADPTHPIQEKILQTINQKPSKAKTSSSAPSSSAGHAPVTQSNSQSQQAAEPKEAQQSPLPHQPMVGSVNLVYCLSS